MIGQILAQLSKIISILGTVLGIVQTVQTNTSGAAVENSPFEIDTATQEALAILTDGTFGLAALQAQLATFQATTAVDVTALLTAIGTPQQAGVPVTIDPASTITIGIDSAAAIVVGVWSYLTPQGQDVADALGQTWVLLNNLAPSEVFDIAGLPWMTRWSLNGWTSAIEGYQAPLLIDETTILSTDADRQAWLNRVTSPALWEMHGFIGIDVLAYPDQDNDEVWWICTMTEGQFVALRDGGSSSVRVAPVWPGIDNTSFLPNVAIDVTVRIDAAMDGCLVYIDSVPSKTGFFTFGDQISYRNIGAVAFINDDLDVEFPQLIGFQDGLYMPKAMEHASGAVFRFAPGVTGNIATFTNLP